MSGMIDRVARALAEADELQWTFMFDSHRDEPSRDDYRRRARAAIEAMRKPTEAMIEAVRDPHEGLSAGAVEYVWDAMIDAALK